jgi:hypothetical protein
VISSTFGSAGSISGISEGKAVSFSSSGNIQAGAGTSVYMNIATVNVDCPSYPALLALTNSAYLLSYADEANEKSTLQLIQVSSTATGMTGSSIKTLASTYYIYDMVLLPNSNGVFVAICQDASVNDETAYVIVGQADANTATITLFDSSAILYATKYSMNPSIVALSSNSFLIGYYNAEPYELALKFGRIDFSSASPVVTLSQPLIFQSDATNSFYFTLSSLTSTTSMVLLYNNTTPMDVNGSGPLQAAVAAISGGSETDATQAAISLGKFSVLESTAVSYYMAATSLNEQNVVVAYADASQDYAIVCQVVSFLPQTSTSQSSIVFGSSWTVNTGRASTGNLKTGLMDIDITTVSTSGEFMVVYSDLSANAATIAAMAQLSATGSIIRTSPDFLLNQGNSNLDTISSWSALAGGVTAPLQSQTAVLNFLASTDCSALATSSFNIVERFPNPVGVVTPSAEVAVQGSSVVTSSNNLIAGKKYYATTKGNLVADNNFAGRGAGYCPATTTTIAATGCTGYVYDAATNVLVSLDGQVGLALSTNTLALATAV